ncbi:DNA ligase, partial [Campylobacter jejuni]|nr:DNA ligase [Campylobacter jejuni]
MCFLICCACLVFANEILLLSKFDKQDFNSKDFNAYLMSEKLDGVRGIWDGKYLKTRQN